MTDTSEDREPEAEGYEPPQVEEVTSDAGPAVTAAGDSDADEAISLIEEDEDD